MNQEPTEYRSLFLYGMLTCAVILLLIGVYFILANTTAHGISEGGKYSAPRGTPVILNGYWVTALAIVIAVFPTYVLVKRSLRKRYPDMYKITDARDDQ